MHHTIRIKTANCVAFRAAGSERGLQSSPRQRAAFFAPAGVPGLLTAPLFLASGLVRNCRTGIFEVAGLQSITCQKLVEIGAIALR